MKSEWEIFAAYLRKNGIRRSEQRENVLDVFLKTEKHLTIEELYFLSKKKSPEIGYATVSRAMKVICDAGLAEKVDFEDGITRFEHKFGHEHHDHLVCVNCGTFIEVRNDEIEKLQEKMAKSKGFTIIRHKLQLFGLCRECQNK
ncbi:MAG: transcriptional repressor [Fibrobacteria bacterium]|nr:transcriptional repressor [Fibrobacteria bacterium]